MKTIPSLCLVSLLCGASLVFAAEPKDSEVFPPGLIRFDGAAVQQVLDIYKEMSQAQLVTSSNVSTLSATISITSRVQLKRPEALKLIEDALLEQAGVVVTKLDGNRISVTYNEALPIKLAKGAKPPEPGSRTIPILTAPDGKFYFLGSDGRTLVPVSSPTGIPPPIPGTAPRK